MGGLGDQRKSVNLDGTKTGMCLPFFRMYLKTQNIQNISRIKMDIITTHLNQRDCLMILVILAN